MNITLIKYGTEEKPKWRADCIGKMELKKLYFRYYDECQIIGDIKYFSQKMKYEFTSQNIQAEITNKIVENENLYFWSFFSD